MLNNRLTIALRVLRRGRGYAFLNVTGLAVGLACCVLIVLYVRSELAVDTVFQDADRIHRLSSDWAEGEHGLPITAPAPAAEQLAAALPEVESSVRMWLGWLNVRDAGEEHAPAFRRNAVVADANMLDFFGIPLVQGDAATALHEPRSVVIHEDLARAAFGTAEAVGETLLVETFNNGTQPYTVTGVWQALPLNSVTQFQGVQHEIIASYTAGDMLREGAWRGWDNRFLLSYVKLAPNATSQAVTAKLGDFVRTEAPEDLHGIYMPVLDPLSTLYLDDDDGRNRRTVWLLAALAGLILLVACINFANLATAQALERAREVGVRKALGAHRGQLLGSLLGEAVLVACAATALGAFLARALQHAFFSMAGKPLVLPNAWDAPMLVGLMGIALATGLLAGLYPALVLSSFQPVRALKGTLRSGPTALRVRRGLVVAQFAAAVLLLAGAAVVHQQIQFIQSASLGFEHEHVLAVESVPRDWSAEGVARMQPVKARLEAVPGVRAVSLSWETAAEGTGNTFELRRRGQARDDAHAITRFVADEDFDAVFDLELVAGSFLAEGDNGVVLNEQAATLLGAEVGQALVLGDSTEVTTRGIVKDFHFASLHEPIRPLVIAHVDEVHLYRTFSLRLAPGDLGEALQRVEAAWQEALPSVPFDYLFVDDQVARKYAVERRTGTVVALAAVLAMLVAGLGVLGLVSISVVQRRREIGVRKVLGASVASVVGLFARDFGVLALVGAALAIPLTYVLAERWLEDFAYRVDLGWLPFVAAAGLTVGLTLALVAAQAVRAASADPVQSLRHE